MIFDSLNFYGYLEGILSTSSSFVSFHPILALHIFVVFGISLHIIIEV